MKQNLNWILFYISTLLIFGNFWAYTTITPIYISSLGGGELAAGVQNTVFFIGAVIMRVYFAPLAERRGNRTIILIGSFVFATAPILFLLSSSIYSVVIVRLYQATGVATFFIGGPSIVADMAPRDKIGLYMGIYRFAGAMALLIAPWVAMTVIDHIGFSAWFVISACLGALSFSIVILTKVPKPKEGNNITPIEGMKGVLGKERLLPIYFGIAIVSLGLGSLLTFAPLYASELGNIKKPEFYVTLFATASIITTLIVGKVLDRYRADKIIHILLILLFCGKGLLYYLPRNPTILIISGLVTGAGYSGSFLALTTWMIKEVDENLRSIAISIQENCIDIFIAVGSFIFGGISRYIGFGNTFGLMGVTLVILTAAQGIRGLNHRKIEREGKSM